MARSLSNAKVLVSLVAENLSVAVNRRGFHAAAAAAAQGVARMERESGRMGKVIKKETGENSWVPDPITGYYRPANRPDEIDVAELREIFLKQRIARQ